MSAPRSARLPCGHCSTCAPCTSRCKGLCPVCKAPFDHVRMMPPSLERQLTFEELTESFNRHAVSTDSIEGHVCRSIGQAAYDGHEVCLLRALENGSDVETVFGVPSNHEGVGWVQLTPLMLAAAAGRAKCVERLLEAHACLDAEDNMGQTALLHAAVNGVEHCAGQLIVANASLECADRRVGATPLWIAAKGGHESVLQHLIVGRANLEHQSKDGCTPLWAAIKADQHACAIQLIEAGAKLELETEEATLPVSTAKPLQGLLMALIRKAR